MTSQPYIVETAVLLLFAFVFGGLAGFWVRRWLTPRGVAEAPADATRHASEPEAPDEGVDAEATPASAPAVMAAEPEVAGTVPDELAKEPAPSKPSRSSATKKTAKAAGKAKPAAAPEATPVASADDVKGKPDLLSQAREGGPDDLKKIKGIGPKIENTLHGLGVYHYDQIAAWGAGEIAWVDDKLSFRGRIDREGWVSQAKALSEGSSN